jgi:aminoglycoside phosphotransferase (APT) family kinase protein
MDSQRVFIYEAAPDMMPSPLPTSAEIALSSEILSDITGCKVVVVGPYVVKYGHHVSLTEGEVMLYVAKSTSVRVPKIYALYRDCDEQKNFIVMEKIQGKTLKEVWPALEPSAKEDITSQLRTAFNQLRRLPSPAHFCALHGKPLPDAIFETGEDSDCNRGPFETEGQLNQALLKSYVASEARMTGKTIFYARAWPSVFSGHEPVFTHGDIQQKNIMISEVSGRPCVVLIDWETAGWYPSYWEYARAVFACNRFEDDWSFWLEQALDPYLNEYAWMYILMLEMWS